MKVFLLAMALLTVTGVEASILSFKPSLLCQSFKKQDALLVSVLVSQDNQAKLVIKNPLKAGEEAIAYGKKLPVVEGRAGASTKFAATNSVTKENVVLTVSQRPTKVGSITGRLSKIELEKQDAIELVCSPAK